MPEENLNLEWNVWTVDPTTGGAPIAEDPNIPMQDIGGENAGNPYINEQNNFSESLENVSVDNLDNTVPMGSFDNQNNFADQLGSVSEDSFNINNATPESSLESPNVNNFNGMELEAISEWSSSVDSNVFLDYWDDNSKIASENT